VHHGIDEHGDSMWSMCVPSVANFYARAWAPGGEEGEDGLGVTPYGPVSVRKLTLVSRLMTVPDVQVPQLDELLAHLADYEVQLANHAELDADRHHLKHLNSLERLNCIYCGYANGLLAYAREISARTEQYWCPIKHARKIVGRHSRYHRFINFGDAEDYLERRLELRNQVIEETRSG